MTGESDNPAAGNAPSLLDPADWADFSQNAHALLDVLIDRMRTRGEGPVWQKMPESVQRQLAPPSPHQPESIAEIIKQMRELILPYDSGNTHPRFWGWVQGGGTPGGMLAEMTAAAMNSNCGGRDHGGIELERIVLDWARGWFGLPDTAGGVLVSGSSMASLLGLAAARQHRAGDDVRIFGLAGSKLIAYASSEVHVSLIKTFEMLGFGRDSLRAIPVDSTYRMDLGALKAAIEADRRSGSTPFCVIASAGTVNTGAFDDISAIADLCAATGLWLHVDGAFGGLVRLAPSLAPLAAGIERADSIAFDYHKWLHVPYDAGCLLVRDARILRETFAGRPDYLASIGGLSGGGAWPADIGFELSRGFRALKVWFTLKEHGTERLGQAIERNCAQARYLAGKLAGESRIALATPVTLNIVCCRYMAAGLSAPEADSLNGRIAVDLQERGIAVVSTCRLDGRLAMRVCITNHRSRESDFDLLVKAMDEAGGRLKQTPSG